MTQGSGRKAGKQQHPLRSLLCTAALACGLCVLLVWRMRAWCSSAARSTIVAVHHHGDGGGGPSALALRGGEGAAAAANAQHRQPHALCHVRNSVPDAIDAAFRSSGAWGLERLTAPSRTDDHEAEHSRQKDNNELAVNALFASLAADLSAQWEAAVLPLADAGCTSVSLATAGLGVRRRGTAAGYNGHSSTMDWIDKAAAAGSGISSGDEANKEEGGSTVQRRGPRLTALLLVSDQRARLEMHLKAYGVQLATLYHYAESLGYGLELYTHNAPLPPKVPGHFVKILGVKAAFALGYEYVLGLDWDMYIQPFNAVPLTAFFSEWPRASVLVQGESNMCTGAVLYRATPAAWAVLERWWGLALTGCCWRGPLHDQVAFKHMLQDYLANHTGNAMLYPPHERAKLARNRSPHTAHPTELLRLKKSLQKGSDFGFVGLEMMLGQEHSENVPRVGLHSCHGLFWGCIPDNAPALLMHTGHKRAHLAWIQYRMLSALHRWVVLAGGEPPEPKVEGAESGGEGARLGEGEAGEEAQVVKEEEEAARWGGGGQLAQGEEGEASGVSGGEATAGEAAALVGGGAVPADAVTDVDHHEV